MFIHVYGLLTFSIWVTQRDGNWILYRCYTNLCWQIPWGHHWRSSSAHSMYCETMARSRGLLYMTLRGFLRLIPVNVSSLHQTRQQQFPSTSFPISPSIIITFNRKFKSTSNLATLQSAPEINRIIQAEVVIRITETVHLKSNDRKWKTRSNTTRVVQ